MKKTIKTNVAYNNVIDFKTKQKLDYKQWLLDKKEREISWSESFEIDGIKIDGRKHDKKSILGAVVCFLKADTSIDIMYSQEFNKSSLTYVFCDILQILRDDIKDV